MKLLLVEDDAALADGLLSSFGELGFDVTLARTLSLADSAVRTQAYDLMILDLGLPDGDGLELLGRLRSRQLDLPVLILTARDGLKDRVGGLRLGADDYLTKPFDLRELEARVLALLRRSQGGFSQERVVGTLRLDTFHNRFFMGEAPLLLPQREHGVLEALILQAGKVVSKERIAQRLSVGAEELADNAIEVYVHRLRRRLADAGIRIRTFRGLGYLLEVDPDAQGAES
jgi:two-component system OmpR family response regulator